MNPLIVNSLLVIFLTIFSLLILEQAYRVYLFGSASFSIEKMNSVHPLITSRLIKPSNHPEIIYEIKPNLDTFFKLATFKTNANGFRDKDYSLFKSEDVFRVVLIGDSFTMPSGVDVEDSFHSILEDKLKKSPSGIDYQFINFAVGGYNLRQYLASIKFKATEYDPDLIIVGFCAANDHLISRRNKKFKHRVKPITYPFFQSFVFKTLKPTLKRTLKRIISNRRDNDDVVPFSKRQKEYISNIFVEMNAYSKENNVPIIIMHLSIRYNKAYANELENLVVESGLNFVDVSLPFAGKDIREYVIYPIDGHPNGKAHRIFAEELYSYLNTSSENKEIFLFKK